MTVTYILCAAGEGKRFQKDFGDRPKASIKLYGVTLLEWSLRSLPIRGEDRLVLITQKKHRIKEKMYEKVCQTYPFSSISWLEIDYLTRGQLETASLAFEDVLPNSSLVIYNCDTYFESSTLTTLMNMSHIEGIIPCAQAQGDAWSFCQADENDRVIDVREKERISSWASVGFYYFKNASLFFEFANQSLAGDQTQKGEYYIAPLYQKYLQQGYQVYIDKVSLFKPMGTPEQLSEFWNVDVKQLALKNIQPVLVVDLDDTITCDEPGVAYSDKKPNWPVIEKMREFSAAGWQIIIFTSRRMDTFGSNEALILADVGSDTLEWLSRHQVPYNGLRFGKPYAKNGFYVDDKALRPEEFLDLDPTQMSYTKKPGN